MAYPHNLALRILLLILILILVGGLVCLFLENQRLIRNNQELFRNSASEKVAVFFVKATDIDLKLQPLIYSIKKTDDAHMNALQLLLAGPPPELGKSGFIEVFPKGTRVLSCTVKSGLAIVNLNHYAMELNAGSALEAVAVASIVNTLTKLPDVFRVKLLVEGKEVESLAGHVDLSGEFRYTNEYVDPVPIE